MKSVTYYPFSLNAGATLSLPIEGDYFRIQSATGAIDVTVDGVGTLPDLLNGQGLKNVPFKRLTLKDKSGASNTGLILVAFDEFIDNRTYGVNDLSTGSLNTLRQPLASTGNHKAGTNLAANTAEQIFAPGSNLNGAIILSAFWSMWEVTTPPRISLLSKSSAPTSITDGEVYAGAFNNNAVASGGPFSINIELKKPEFVPAGQGLYFLNDVAASNRTELRACRFRLL